MRRGDEGRRDEVKMRRQVSEEANQGSVDQHKRRG